MNICEWSCSLKDLKFYIFSVIKLEVTDLISVYELWKKSFRKIKIDLLLGLKIWERKNIWKEAIFVKMNSRKRLIF